MITLLYTTLPSRDEALSIAHILLEEKLVACANLSAPHTALYYWNGALQQQQETALLCKTSEARLPQALARLNALHPYDCPAILSWSAASNHAAYTDWVFQETDRITD